MNCQIQVFFETPVSLLGHSFEKFQNSSIRCWCNDFLKPTDQFKRSYLVLRLNISNLSSQQIYCAHQGDSAFFPVRFYRLSTADGRCQLTYRVQLLIVNIFSNQDLEKVCQFSRNNMSLQPKKSNVIFSKTKHRNTPPITDERKGITLNKSFVIKSYCHIYYSL